MKWFLSLCLCVCLIGLSPAAEKCGSAPSDTQTNVAHTLILQAVTIRAGRSQGSGVFITTKDNSVWVLTAGHVVAGLRHTRSIVDNAGHSKTVVEFEDAQIVQFEVDQGRKVAEYALDAQVVRYSDADYGHDLALLKVRSGRFRPCTSARFYLDSTIPSPGTKLIHCGSLLGEMGSNSITTGVISANGRVYNCRIYDQTTCTAFPGSSGGGVFTEDGRYVGMVVRGAGEGFNLIVPVRRVLEWAKENGIEGVFNPAKPLNTAKILRKAVEEEENP